VDHMNPLEFLSINGCVVIPKVPGFPIMHNASITRAGPRREIETPRHSWCGTITCRISCVISR
jgi:hypothetical protein